MNEFGLKREYLDKIIKILALYKIQRAVIIGSRAKGNFTQGSDIDIVIFAPELNFFDYLRLISELDELNLPYKIDLLKYEFIKNEKLLEHIERVGKEIYQATIKD